MCVCVHLSDIFISSEDTSTMGTHCRQGLGGSRRETCAGSAWYAACLALQQVSVHLFVCVCVGWLDNAGSFDKLLPLLSKGKSFTFPLRLCRAVSMEVAARKMWKYASHVLLISMQSETSLGELAVPWGEILIQLGQPSIPLPT